MSTILCLPNEILLNIFSFLYYVDDEFYIHGNKNDLLASRLTCNKLAIIGTSFLFEHITLINDTKGYKMLLLLSQSPVANYVRRFSCQFQAFDLSAENFDQHRYRTPQTMDMYETEYLPRKRRQKRLEAHNLDTRTLEKAIPLFKNLCAIRIIQDFDSRYGTMFQVLDCSVRERLAWSPLGQRLFEAITSAILKSQINLELLQLGSIDDNKYCQHEDILFGRLYYQPPIFSVLQKFTIARRGLYQQAFRNLRQLRIRLPFRRNNNFNDTGLLVFLESAQSLEELWIQFYDRTHALTSELLRSLRLSRLRSLKLDWALIEDSLCLIDFLGKHATSLDTISFIKLALTKGSWENVFTEMRRLLTLKSISIRGAFEIGAYQIGFETEIKSGLREHGRIVLSKEAIEDFVHRKIDDNPFELVRSAHKVFPPHAGGEWECTNICPYRA